MSTIFKKIIDKEIPAQIIAEDEKFLAFLDIQPLVEGHVLVIPKVEVDYVFDLDDDVLCGLTLFAKKVAKSLKIAINCKRIGVAVIGLEVAHVHIHLVPLNTMDDINFTREKLQLSNDELTQIAQKIISKM